MSAALDQVVGLVAIGRNEGERLRRCLESVRGKVAAIVYVDSGSVDDSVNLARSMGVEVVQLDQSAPYTAARSRNAGIKRLQQIAPGIQFVQVVDGDCEVVAGWLERAFEAIVPPQDVAIVCGRRRERHPEASIYNRLCDMEWNTPIGETQACGGDAMIRIAAFNQGSGYDESIIAGEEPELCLRLRKVVETPWRILRIDHDMTLHDAAMARVGQWWKRCVRSGHAYAEGRAMHGRRHGYCVREVRSIVEWSLLLPLLALALAWLTWGASLLLLGGYAILVRRIRAYRLQYGDSPDDAALYANYCVLGKFAQLVGVSQYWWNRLRGRRTKLIEYKAASHQSDAADSTGIPQAQKT